MRGLLFQGNVFVNIMYLMPYLYEAQQLPESDLHDNKSADEIRIQSYVILLKSDRCTCSRKRQTPMPFETAHLPFFSLSGGTVL
jgi:hypothetical protein